MGPPETKPDVVVGYDSSQASLRALAWAVQEARLRGLPVTVCHAWQWSYPVRPVTPLALEPVRRMAEHITAIGVTQAHQLDPELEVRSVIRTGSASAVLLEAARTAEMVVLGCRGHAGFADLRLGSAAYQVPTYATCPVVVVRGESPAEPTGRIVAGVDGSPISEAVLEFAYEEARLRHAEVHAVCSWWEPGAVPGPELAPFIDTDAMRHVAAERFERALVPWRRKYADVPLQTCFVAERPRPALLHVARNADLLVVGRRGFGGRCTVLGPVSHSMLHHSACPVAIVQDTAERR